MRSRQHSARHPARRLPPYCHELAARLRQPKNFSHFAGTSADGRRPQLWVGLGPNAWAWAQRHIERRLLTLLPPGDNPSAFDWRLLSGFDPVFIVACGPVEQSEIRALVAAIMRDGTQKILVGGDSAVVVYERTDAHGNH